MKNKYNGIHIRIGKLDSDGKTLHGKRIPLLPFLKTLLRHYWHQARSKNDSISSLARCTITKVEVSTNGMLHILTEPE